MKHTFYAAVHITLKSRTRGLLLYGRAASVTLENYHSLFSEISKMSYKTLIYYRQQCTMSILTEAATRGVS